MKECSSSSKRTGSSSSSSSGSGSITKQTLLSYDHVDRLASHIRGKPGRG
jgi:hypothetical protein